jgi:hypothetical protein|eukprot:g3859.t1
MSAEGKPGLSSASLESGSSEIDLPFYLTLNTKSHAAKDLRACIDFPNKLDDVEIPDIRGSLDYLSPVRSTTFKNYDVPNELEWQLRRKKDDPGPGGCDLRKIEIPGGTFSQTPKKKKAVDKDNHLGPGFYQPTLGVFNKKTIKGGTFSKLPNINATEQALRKGSETPGYYHTELPLCAPCTVNYSIVNVGRKPSVEIPPAAKVLETDTFGSGRSAIIRKKSSLVEKIGKFKILMENQAEYFIDSKLKEREANPNGEKYIKSPVGKCQIMRSALKRLTDRIVKTIDEAGEKEMFRLHQKKSSNDIINDERNRRARADRRVTEALIKDLLTRQKRLQTAYHMALRKAGMKVENTGFPDLEDDLDFFSDSEEETEGGNVLEYNNGLVFLDEPPRPTVAPPEDRVYSEKDRLAEVTLKTHGAVLFQNMAL